MQVLTGAPIQAKLKSSRRAVSCRLVVIEPLEESPIALPYDGYTPTKRLQLALDGEDEYLTTHINYTGKPITIYQCEWLDTGNNAGYYWNKHLVCEN